ncbi:MAG TPA: hypothetical protein VM869_10880 [Enhygromyxa sp.]|nr:hypothetical protein [Enhygromyxa sp.]
MSKAIHPVTFILLATLVATGCARDDELKGHPRAQSSDTNTGWGCRKFGRDPYDPDKIERACDYAKSIHGRPRTRGACEKLAALISDVSVPIHSCADNMACIQAVARDIGMERFPDCSTLPDR